eukprot:TRINITY_DN4385_c0_g1_i2.p2 TRINITY_DN4385_c0_g1~~TRINITY_DN4385_c0_g1_i2.p2  ORF type:complete len:128 (+),score=13.05 TRINITY_DN4385_c0_g1_i2:473-856(+)
MTPGLATEALADSEPRGPFEVRIDQNYVPVFVEHTFTWGGFEEHGGEAARMVKTMEVVRERYPGETVLMVSHGGPTEGLYSALTGDETYRCCGYCGLFGYVKVTEQEGWRPVVVADHEHLTDVRNHT